MFMSMRNIDDANITLYCDKESYNFFKSIPYVNDIKIVDYSKYDFDERAWNFPKFVSYSLQKDPFVHIDFDLTILKPMKFSSTADIFSEKIRDIEGTEQETIYCDKSLPCPKQIYCSGLFGGNNIELFQKICFYAEKYFNKEFCKEKEIVYENLYGLEEVLFTQLATKDNCTVQFLDPSKYMHFWERPKEARYSQIINNLSNLYRIC